MKLPPLPAALLAGTGLAAAAAVLALAACGGAGTSDTSTVTVQGDVPIAYVMRKNTIGMNPTNGAPTAPGGDLMIREKSSPSAPEHNVTASITQGKGDASDPEPSYDGKKIIFSLRCPTSNTSTTPDGQPACTGRWNIWEYDMTTGGLTGGTFRRLTASTTDDDVDPVYLPAGQGFVFASNRQAKSKNGQALGRTYFALDEYERERVFNLHTMAADGTNIQQITFNQSHDRNPVIRPNGDIMFSHWDHVGGRNHFKIFTVKPDGTDLFVLYGAHSDGNSFLHPRDLDPDGQFPGIVSSDLMPLQRTAEGGALMAIDVAHYSEQHVPAAASVPGTSGQRQATLNQLNIDRGLSMYGRITTPYPLWDKTDRVLVAYRPCEVHKDGRVVPCSELTTDEIARLSDMDRSVTELATDTVKDDVPPPYAIYMFNALNQSFLNVASPPPGMMYTDPIALIPRKEPASTSPTSIDADLAAKGLGTLDVRSVYDTDELGRMGDPVLGNADLVAGCTVAIAKTLPTDPNDLRPQVADLAKMKDPADPAYPCAPARFIRAVRAVAPPANMMGLRSAIGETDFEPQQILGYAPIEPDGSFKLNVPADTPIGLAVVDAQGRALQTHTNWIQVRPGERRTCDGCHSPRRGGALNSGAIVNETPSAWLASMQAAHQSGETMADTRTRLDPTSLTLKSDMAYSDIWADTAKPGITRLPDVLVKYVGNAKSTDDLATPVPTNGIINYPDHIQPLWTRDRGANTCTNCHKAPDHLDLTGTQGGDGRITSYDSLLIGDPQLDSSGRPVIFFDDGVPMVQRLPALVNTAASEGEALGLARKSRLVEILAGQTLMSDAASRTTHPTPMPPIPNHGRMLNAAEKRLVAEWIDLGAKYYNDPFNAGSGVREIDTLDQPSFTSTIYPIINANCATCHVAHGSTDTQTAATSFRDNRYVLTGDPDGDFGATLSMISDVCTPPASYLLARPSTIPHPAALAGTQTTAILPTTSANYQTIASWIATGCTSH